MPKLHLFYPENDIALASDLPRFTAPRAALDLHIAGETLAMFTGNPGDKFLTQGVSAEWFDRVSEAFALSVMPFNGDSRGLSPSPWGWSRASRTVFADSGFTPDALPTDAALSRMRQLSHRRTALQLAAALPDLVAPPGIEAFTVDEALAAVEAYSGAVVKSPWSSSGRGVIYSASTSPEMLAPRIAGTIGRQGSVIVERFYPDIVDFALLYEADGANITFTGYSFFAHDAHFRYSGSMLAPDSVLKSAIEQAAGSQLPDGLEQAVAAALYGIIGTDYTGLLGVDMMALRLSGSGRPGPQLAIAEVNLRNTMGHVAHTLAARFLAPGTTGRYTVEPRRTPDLLTPADCRIADRRIVSGALDLAPADRRFRLLLQTHPQ